MATDKAGVKEWLSAAECAKRTGLTVRALRVYEREGLIKPSRSAKGWRRYGEAELARLNTIVILKTLGLSLVQVRKVLREHPPTLMNILQIQAQSWQEKRAAADRALFLVDAARKRLHSQQTLSIDELCALIKKFESNRPPDGKGRDELMREIINRHITPEEEREWHMWWRNNADVGKTMQEFVTEQEGLFVELERLAQEGADPGSAAVQDIIGRHNEVLLRHRLRELTLRLIAWNAPLTLKWFGLSYRADKAGVGLPGAKGRSLFVSGMQASATSRQVAMLITEIIALVEAGADPGGAQLDGPVMRFEAMCATHRLGNPVVFARWLPFIRRAHRDDYAPGPYEAAWEFLAHAVDMRLGRKAA
ncbi:MAG TPA: MerR family transcriptional regulator [Steroidobacteraceae bacterium]|jgi:DNA-binding transcriptional MerR regulator